MLVVIDEAQLFTHPSAGEVSDVLRKISLSAAVIKLMCQGRKRGLADVICYTTFS